MRIDVSQQLKSPIGTIQDYEVSEVIDILGDGSNCLVQGEVSLMRTSRGILVNGTLHTDVEITCSRCLALFSCPLTLKIEEEYCPITDVVASAPLPLPNEPGCFVIDERHVLDLTEALCQYAVLAMPMKPLCRQDCAGLCPHCGHNLNQGTCHCPPQAADPRRSILLSLAGDTPANERKGAE